MGALALALACGNETTASGTGGQAGTHHHHEDASLGGASGSAGGSASGSAAGLGGGGAAGESGVDAAGDAPAVVCDLGTMYPTLDVIDPDAPVYSDASWTQGAVVALFDNAKAKGSIEYLAYRAARDYSHVLDCAFCSCGCAPSIGHLSAIDCFKDMHGFA